MCVLWDKKVLFWCVVLVLTGGDVVCRMPVFRCSRSGEKAVGNQRLGLLVVSFAVLRCFKKLLDGDEMICKMRTFAERHVERTN